MKQIDYHRTDMFRARLYSRINPLHQGFGGVSQLLSAIDTHVGPFTPSMIAGGTARSYRYTHPKAQQLLETQRNSKWLILERKADPFMLFTLDFIERPPSKLPYGFGFEIKTPFPDAHTAFHSAAISTAFLNILRAVAQCCPTLYAWAHSDADVALGTELKLHDLANPQITAMYWLNILGAAMVDQIGRDRVLTTPVFQREVLPDGAVLLVTQPTPWNFASADARHAQAQALAHLRPDVNEAAIRDRLRAQSATLAPVERDWDPDVADLLTLVLDEHPFAERQQQIKRLNAYRPPPVSEWSPLPRFDPDAPVDLAGMSATTARCNDLAERLIALLHSAVPALLQGDPSSLPLLDFHFWRTRVVTTYERAVIDAMLLPRLGAYLGTLLRRTFDGYWLPAATLDETALVVGDRAWLPFRRAKHFLQSPQAALDYSFSQFYNTVKRSAEQP